MSFQVLETVPILRIFSVEKAREFYVGFLGFAVDWEHRFDAKAPVYMQVSRAGCVLHLTEYHGDCCPGSTVFVRVKGLEEFHREITAKGYGFLRPGVERTCHDSRCMEVIDPFGNRIRFDESMKDRLTTDRAPELHR
jgi:catechol 2,3-dioxygenase-like lactoylglutathione lyase family enzyme